MALLVKETCFSWWNKIPPFGDHLLRRKFGHSGFFFFFFFLNNFCKAQVLFVGPLIPLFWTSGDVCPGFQSQGGFPHLCASSPAHNGFLRFTSGATPAFSTNRGVHCISVYTAWLARLLSHASGFEPPTQWWAAQRCVTNFGHSGRWPPNKETLGCNTTVYVY